MKPVRKKPVRPVRETKHSIKDPKIEFAWHGKMITRQEYDEAYKGEVLIDSKEIFNINAPLPNFPTGTRQQLYVGRGPYLEAKNFLEM